MAPHPDIELSPAQQKAVDSHAPAIVVTAGAGSGKTEVVARRVERLLTADASGYGRVLAVSYTEKASAELRDRLEDRLGGDSQRVDCSTLHHFAHSLIRKYGPLVGLPLEPPVTGNAYATDHPRVPGTLRDAHDLFAASTVARSAFGDEVVEHYLNNARVELEAFDAAVTDWERVRGFERL